MNIKVFAAPFLWKTIASIVLSSLFVVIYYHAKDYLPSNKIQRFELYVSFFIAIASFILSIIVLYTAEGLEKYVCKKIESAAIVDLYNEYKKKDKSGDIDKEEITRIRTLIRDGLDSNSLPSIVEQKLKSCITELDKEHPNFLTFLSLLKKAVDTLKSI